MIDTMKGNLAYTGREHRNGLYPVFFLTFPVVGFWIFFVYVNITSIFMAFQ